MEKEKNYPGVFDRVKAATLDSIVVVLMIVITTDILSNFNDVHNGIRVIAFFLLYDPISTSFFGATIGHRYIGICVKRNDLQYKNIHFLKATLRFFIKLSLRWISLLYISRSSEKKAIHDTLTGSILLYNKKIK